MFLFRFHCWQSADCACRTAAVLRRASTSVRVRGPAPQALSPANCHPCHHSRSVVRHHLSLPVLGLRYVTGCLTVLACLSIDQRVALGETPPEDAQGCHEPESMVGGLRLARGGERCLSRWPFGSTEPRAGTNHATATIVAMPARRKQRVVEPGARECASTP